MMRKLYLMLFAAFAIIATVSCSDEMIEEVIEDPVPEVSTIQEPTIIHVIVSAGTSGAQTKSTVVYDGDAKTRTLKFTTGDCLYIDRDLAEDKNLAGTLTLKDGSLAENGLSATFEGTLKVYASDGSETSYDFGSEDPLKESTAFLLHKDMVAGLYTYETDKSPAYHQDKLVAAADVETLMTTMLLVSGSYTVGTGYSLSTAATPILNCNFSGLTASTEYRFVLKKDGSEAKSVKWTTDGIGTAAFAFASLVSGSGSWTLVVKQGETAVGTIDFGTKDFTSKVYNVSRRFVDLSDASIYINNVFTAQNGDILKGTPPQNKKITIADGATVTLNGVTINGTHNDTFLWAGLTCLGNATIILKDGTTNTVKGFNWDYPGIYVPDGSTLVIKGETLGTGSLDASSRGKGAGIGGGYTGPSSFLPCGNITISGGIVTATGGYMSAGIGGGNTATCGNITITGGEVTATGGQDGAGIGSGGGGNNCGNITITGGKVTAAGGSNAAGIGSGRVGSGCKIITISGGTVNATGSNEAAGIGSGSGGICKDITITSTVEQVTATKGSGAPDSIGYNGEEDERGTVTIGGTVYYGPTTDDPSVYEYKNGGDSYLTQSPLVYPAPAPSVPTGAINGLFSVSGTKQVYFSRGNLQYTRTSTGVAWETGQWSFMEHQYDLVETNSDLYCDGDYDNKTAVSLFGWGTSGINYDGHATTYQPWMTSEDNTRYNPYGSMSTNLYDGDSSVKGMADWGYNEITNGGNQTGMWRTLTLDEWDYLYNSRVTGSTLKGTPNARFTLATINKTSLNDDSGVTGAILFPDNYSGPTSDIADVLSWGDINGTSLYSTECTAEGWNTLEAAGCVFLPAAGSRRWRVVDNVGRSVSYWSSSRDASNDQYAHPFSVDEYNNPAGDSCDRLFGLPVRLVIDIN